MRLGDVRTCLTFVPWSVCPVCGLVAYTGPPDVALMMPFYEKCCVSAESDWFWFCVSIESVSHQDKFITLNVNVFTSKIRSLLIRCLGGWNGGSRSIYYLFITHYEAGTCRDSTYTLRGVFWSNIVCVSSWVIACEQGTVIVHVFKAPNLLLSFMSTFTTLLLAFLSSLLFSSTSASVIITSSIKYSW